MEGARKSSRSATMRGRDSVKVAVLDVDEGRRVCLFPAAQLRDPVMSTASSSPRPCEMSFGPGHLGGRLNARPRLFTPWPFHRTRRS